MAICELSLSIPLCSLCADPACLQQHGCDVNSHIHCALCAADLDDENQELRQKLSSLLQESRHKESVNQALITEVSELGLKQKRAQSGGYPTP